MAQWVRPEYSKARIDKSAEALVPWWQGKAPQPTNLGDYYGIVENWRTSHAMPLLTFRVSLEARARRVDPQAIVAQRLKRFSSAMNKLVREPNMKLTQMQDLGGCRAILASVSEVDQVYEKYEEGGGAGEQQLKCYDYIREPKSDGYRGIHIIGRYAAQASKNEPWNGQRIEIQLRSRLQHAFATAVETVTTFTKQPLKFGAGPDEWRRFFSLVGSAFALKEGTTLVKDTPTEKSALIGELRHLTNALYVYRRLGGWTKAMTKLKSRNIRGFNWLLLVLNLENNTIRVTGFADRAKARSALSKLEPASGSSQQDAVLVWVSSLRDLRRAYPNYFADTEEFLGNLGDSLRENAS